MIVFRGGGGGHTLPKRAVGTIQKLSIDAFSEDNTRYTCTDQAVLTIEHLFQLRAGAVEQRGLLKTGE